jgi:hypothetical protein
LPDLLSNDIDIVREVDLLNKLDDESRQQANDNHKERNRPESWLSENLRGCLVEKYRSGG